MNIYQFLAKKRLRKIKSSFLDLIFPKFCVGCQVEGKWVCDVCVKKIVLVKTQTCPQCGIISEKGKFCHKCSKGKALSGIVVAAYYEEGPIKEAIHNLKYNHVLELGEFLGELMAAAYQENLIIADDTLITAVPMHFLKKAQRGYNQAEVLAKIVADKISSKGGPASGWKIKKNFKIIKKIRKTVSQVKFSGKKRRENLKNSFKIIDYSAVKNRTVIIVDDVTTTGTTLNECAKVLKASGAKKVWGLVIARG